MPGKKRWMRSKDRIGLNDKHLRRLLRRPEWLVQVHMWQNLLFVAGSSRLWFDGVKPGRVIWG